MRERKSDFAITIIANQVQVMMGMRDRASNTSTGTILFPLTKVEIVSSRTRGAVISNGCCG